LGPCEHAAHTHSLAGLHAIHEPFALVLGWFRQRVQLHALVERRFRYLVEIVARGFAAARYFNTTTFVPIFARL
jgi:hypothetical protein